jgi:hypothetical protein
VCLKGYLRFVCCFIGICFSRYLCIYHFEMNDGTFRGRVVPNQKCMMIFVFWSGKENAYS